MADKEQLLGELRTVKPFIGHFPTMRTMSYKPSTCYLLMMTLWA